MVHIWRKFMNNGILVTTRRDLYVAVFGTCSGIGAYKCMFVCVGVYTHACINVVLMCLCLHVQIRLGVLPLKNPTISCVQRCNNDVSAKPCVRIYNCTLSCVYWVCVNVQTKNEIECMWMRLIPHTKARTLL